MKKILTLVLCIACIPSLASSALGEGTDATLPSDYTTYGSFYSACEWQGSLLLLCGKGLYRLEPGGETPERLMDLSLVQGKGLSSAAPEGKLERELWEQGMTWLFTDGESLFGLHPCTGQVYKLEGSAAVPYTRIPEEQLFYTEQEKRMPKEIKSLLFFEGKLYMALMSFTFEKGDSRELFTWDMQSPTMHLLNTKGLEGAFPGPAGELLLKLKDADGAFALWRYDIAKEALTQKVWEGDTISGCVWREEDQSLHFTGEGGRVQKALSGTKVQTKAYLPIAFAGIDNQAILYRDGSYVYLDSSGLFVRDISMEGERRQTAVHIMGYISPDIAVAFSARYPDVSLVIDDGASDFLSIQQSMVSGDDGVDLYIVSTAGAYGEVRDKGYAAPMNASAELVEQARQFYPAIREALFKEDKLLAFPVNFQENTWTLNRTVWDRLGLGEYPLTFAQVFAALENWIDQYAPDNPEYSFIEVYDGLRGYVAMIMKQYLLEHETGDVPVSFDDPAFREAVQATLDYREILGAAAENTNPIIMTYNQYLGVGYNDSDEVISIPLPALNEDSPRMVRADMELFVLNPLSKNQQPALEFVSFYARQMDERFKYALNASLNTPLRYKNFEAAQQELMENVLNMEKLLETAAPEDKNELKAMIDQEKRRYQLREEENWLISQETIDIYREIARHLVVPLQSIFSNDPFSEEGEVIEQVIGRFTDGQLTVDQFVKELDAKALMMFKEGK